MLDGTKLKTLRKDAGLSAERLGAAAGVTGRHIRRMEAGTSQPTLGVAHLIAQAVGVPVSSLIHDPEAAMPATGCGSNHDDGAAADRRSPVVAHPGG